MFQLKWVWKNLEGCRKRYIAALCSTVVLAVMVLGTSLITANIMDTVFKPLMETGQVTEEARQRLIVLVAVLIGYTLLRTTMAYFSVITYETCSQKLVYKLRKDLYRNMQEQDQDFYSRNRTGDLMTRLTGDMDMVRFMVAWIIRQLIDCTVLFLTTSICFLVTDWLFALSLLGVFRALPYPWALGAVVIALLLWDRPLFARIDYGLLLTFLCFFVFAGNMGNIGAVREFLNSLLERSAMLTSLLASQVISNVPAAVLLSGFTQDGQGLLVGTNLGGLGTLIASLASLISFRYYLRLEGAKPLRYLGVFTGLNLAGLAVLTSLALCLSLW